MRPGEAKWETDIHCGLRFYLRRSCVLWLPTCPRAVSIQVLSFEGHARWHFLEKNAIWRIRFCKEQNRNRCSRKSKNVARMGHRQWGVLKARKL